MSHLPDHFPSADAGNISFTNYYAKIVDIIIPMLGSLQEAKDCLISVLAHPQNTPVEIIIINDCSLDEDLNEYLGGLTQQQEITLLQSPFNLGFINTVNRAIALHPDRDVVVLYNGTQVHGNWLDRLRRCAYSDSSVGTVTPFSNNAAVCSYPRFCRSNLLPADWSSEELDHLFSELNSDQSIEIPAIFGCCCTYIRRNCLNQVGYFDAATFERSSESESDFSMRSFELGFRHLLCADVFVYHKGNTLFSGKENLHIQSAGKIQELYPHYLLLLNNFCARDPARVLRRRVDIARLMQSARRKLLFITHAMGGGTEKHVQELAKLLESNFEIFILRPTAKEEISIEWARAGEEFIAYFQLPHSYPDLLGLIKKLEVSYIHCHHIIGFNQQILQLPKDLGAPYDFTLHDYYPICPQYTLTLEDGSYCGEPDAAGCSICLSRRPALWGMDILSWRTFFQNILVDAERVIAPSCDMLERMKNYVPNAHYVYLPHPELPTSSPETTTVITGNALKILVLGRLSLAKGLKLLENCAMDASVRNLPLHFRVIGFPVQEVKNYPDTPLSFYGSYDDTQLPSLIQLERADAIFFPALWPETYSYTLSYAINSRLPIIAPRLGAFTERLAKYPLAWLLDWDSDAVAYNDLFMSLQHKTLHFDPSWKTGLLSQELFLEHYLKDFLPLKPITIMSKKTSKIIIELDIEQYYYQPHNSFESHINILNRSELLKILQTLAAPDDSLRITPDQLISCIKELRSEIGQQQEYQMQQREKMVKSDEQLSHYREENIRQKEEINKLGDLIIQKNADIEQLNADIEQLNQELYRMRQLIAELWVLDSPKKKRTLIVSGLLIKIYRSWLIFFPIRLVRAAMRGDKRFLFDAAVNFRNKINGFRNRVRENFPRISYFIVEPPFFIARWSFKSMIRQVFYENFNEMIYELQQKSIFPNDDSKDDVVNNKSATIANFIVSERFEHADYSFCPKVTIIVPNYNHGKFLQKRLDSIYQQTYRHFNVVLLDDFSSDNSREILSEYARSYSKITQTDFNSKNTGSVFMQWKKGIERADGDLIWIAESDDFCDRNFLETLVPFFMDEAIQLAYARSVFIGPDDQPAAFAFDDYLSELGADKWLNNYVESAHHEVINALGKKNTIPNVSSAIFRRPQDYSLLKDESWLNMKICGDWIFYLHLIRGAKIAFSNNTRNYYRFHSANSSVSTYQKLAYYQEHEYVAKTIAQRYNAPDATLYANRRFVENFWEQNMKEFDKSAFNTSYAMDSVLKFRGKRLPNIMVASYSFSTGGGEIFPIRLANELKKKGYGITFFNFNREPVNANVRRMLSSDIPVCEYNQKTGCLDKLLNDFGIEIVHTHHASTEHFFATYMKNTRGAVKHIVTMHGMYETLEKIHIDNNLPVIMNNVDLWVYIADKNIELFSAKNYYDKEKFIKIGNGMEPPVIHAIDRSALNIPDHAFILCQASRAMLEKGWEEAIAIVTEARNLSGKDIHLILLGDGLVYESLLMRELPDYIHLLGFQNNPVDFYAMSDMGFLASRFRGESFPLSIIECLFSGNPFIASDIGEIRNMLTTEEGMAGAVFSLDDWKIPVKKVAQIVADFASNQALYQKAKSLAPQAAQPFCIENIIADYEKAYQKVLSSND